MPRPTRAAYFFVVLLPLVLPPAVLAQQQIRPPLHANGHKILDSAGRVVRLTAVNWYGFDQKEYLAGGLDHARLETIIAQIRDIGVNSVRLPWANETLKHNPPAADYAVRANPKLRGKHALDVLDAVIAALARARIMVILDNHMSRADWCCTEADGNGLWYNAEYPEEKWLADWETIDATGISHGSWALICATNCATEQRGAAMIRGWTGTRRRSAGGMRCLV